MKLKFSICVPTKNRVSALKNLLDKHRSSDFNFIVSVETSELSLYENITKQFNIDVVVLDDDKGIGYARNRLALRSQSIGDNVTFFCDDNSDFNIDKINKFVDSFYDVDVKYLAACNYCFFALQSYFSDYPEWCVIPVKRMMAQVFAFRTDLIEQDINFDERLRLLEDADFILKVFTKFYPNNSLFACKGFNYVKKRHENGGNIANDNEENLLLALNIINKRFDFPVMVLTERSRRSFSACSNIKDYAFFLDNKK